MLRSMTGFGRAFLEASFGRLTIEIQSVNRKYFEVFVLMPKELFSFETELRKWIAKEIPRGQVTVRVALFLNEKKVREFFPDSSVLKNLKKEWDRIALEAGVDTQGIDLPFLMQYLPQQAKEASDEEFLALKACAKQAIDALIGMKLEEGTALKKDLLFRLEQLKKMLKEVERYAPDATKKMRASLEMKLEELFKLESELEERLLREVAIFAEKTDISEEIVRLKSHLDQFEDLLSGGVVGRKMDFLIQEMGREINTIGSKSMEAKISHVVVSMKSELEKMREQVQNLE